MLLNYSDKAIQYFECDERVGAMDQDDPSVRTGKAGQPDVGDVVQIQLQVIDDVIVKTCYKVYGSTATIAAASYATAELKGKSILVLKQITHELIIEALDLPKERHYAAMLVEEAILNMSRAR